MMEDLLNLTEQQTPQLPEYTVSEISFEIKKFVETTFNRVKIRGEIFGAKRADSGHWYLSLKDPNAVLSAVIWKGTASRLSFKPEDGMEVIATGKITTLPAILLSAGNRTNGNRRCRRAAQTFG